MKMNEQTVRGITPGFIKVLDRIIVTLMVAIILAVSGPVCLLFWQQTHPASPPGPVVTASAQLPLPSAALR